MNVMKEIERINQRELDLNISETGSWHHDYRHSAYIFIGGLDSDLTEGDLLAIFSQFGEVVDLHLVRDKTSGRSLGYGFLAFEDQRSTILAIDNMNGYKLLNRHLCVDHADKFRRPKGQQPAAAAGDDSKYQVLNAPEDDPEYDERRKRIWDYERYQTQAIAQKPILGVGEVPAFVDQVGGGPVGAATPASSESTADTKHADRVMQMLKAKREERIRKPTADEAQAKGERRRRSRSRERDQR